MVKKILPIVVVIVVIGAVGYYLLGGGESIQFEIREYPDLHVTGKEFLGKYNDGAVKDLFFEAKQISESREGCDVTVIHYETPELQDSVRQFIGVSSPDSSFVSGKAFNEVRSFEKPTMLKAVITAHNFVMPRPEEVKSKASEYAKEKGYELEGYSIEVYKGTRDLEILFPLKKL
ncbi:hypothetical protein [Fulvivirga ligni]|uniref:hypothetical protein n=1 Tax=Fulvivirga ligni TaxID=2904246 RepID=UPI001F1C3040|nr:hypothetical protein [Fulvivirga ligni]UII22384.1 hypothetical protein LVD16_03955 [Fulvivirga ligni]